MCSHRFSDSQICKENKNEIYLLKNISLANSADLADLF